MVKEISIQVAPEKEKDAEFIKTRIFAQLKEKSIQFDPKDTELVFQKKSIDARRKNIKLFLRYKVYIGE